MTPFPGGRDDARRLVPEDRRRLRRDVPRREVAAAEADRLHLDEKLPRRRSAGHRHLDDLDVVERADERGLHGTITSFITSPRSTSSNASRHSESGRVPERSGADGTSPEARSESARSASAGV